MAYNPLVLTEKARSELKATVQHILAPGKGILATDEHVDDLGNALKKFGLANNIENRRTWREVLMDSEADFSKSVSAIILCPESLYQKTFSGERFVDVLKKKGVAPGVNVGGNLTPLPFTNEIMSEGLDGLHDRVMQYKKDGAVFAKWRAPFSITVNTPTTLAIEQHAFVLARYAAICQTYGIVPIVEPDVALTGDYDIVTAQKVYENILATLYKALRDYNVYLEGTILKTAFISNGSLSKTMSSSQEVAVATIQTLQRTVPAAVPGIVFLSGGHSEEVSTLHLDAVVKQSKKDFTTTQQSKCPWVLTFCYGRALIGNARTFWSGKKENVPLAKKELLKRAQINSKAALGQYL